LLGTRGTFDEIAEIDSKGHDLSNYLSKKTYSSMRSY